MSNKPTPAALRAASLVLARWQPGLEMDPYLLTETARDIDKATGLPLLLSALAAMPCVRCGVAVGSQATRLDAQCTGCLEARLALAHAAGEVIADGEPVPDYRKLAKERMEQ